jgi:hypothetical protein
MKTSHLSTCIALSCVTLAASPVTSQTTTSVPLHFENTDVREILPLYESLTHFRIIRDNFVQGKISISAPQPVDPPVAIDMIERSFFANGFAIIQLDPETVEIVGVGRNARSSGVPAISDPKQLPEHERLVSCLFQFRRADAKAIQQLFGSVSFSSPRVYFLPIVERCPRALGDRKNKRYSPAARRS